MKKSVKHVWMLPLLLVFAGLGAQSALAEEAADPGKGALTDALMSCNKWMNCDTESPNFTGTCCRQCDDKQGAKVWDCKVFSEGEHFDTAEWSGTD